MLTHRRPRPLITRSHQGRCRHTQGRDLSERQYARLGIGISFQIRSRSREQLHHHRDWRMKPPFHAKQRCKRLLQKHQIDIFFTPILLLCLFGICQLYDCSIFTKADSSLVFRSKRLAAMRGVVLFPFQDLYFPRNSVGVIPVTFLKSRVKWCGYSKPRRCAVSLMLCPFMRRFFP